MGFMAPGRVSGPCLTTMLNHASTMFSENGRIGTRGVSWEMHDPAEGRVMPIASTFEVSTREDG